MERSDFINRKGERKVDFLKYYGLIERIYARDNDLSLAMFRLILYLDAVPYFTRQDFLDGTLYFTWDKRLFNKILKDGWINVIKNGYRKAGDHNHYNVSLKGKLMVTSVYKILCGEMELPEKYKRTREKAHARYIDKTEKTAIKAMEQSRAKERRENF